MLPATPRLAFGGEKKGNPMRQKPKASTLHGWAGVLALWHLCPNASCHAARACRGDIHRCAPENFARLPEDVQAWFFGLLSCRDDGLTFDEAMAELDETNAGPAFHDWCAVVRAAREGAARERATIAGVGR